MGDEWRNKLRFRASRRGFRELDLFMEAFAAAHLDQMDDGQLAEFEQVLEWPDQEVYSWILGGAEPPPEARSGVLDLVLSFGYSARVKDNAGSAS